MSCYDFFAAPISNASFGFSFSLNANGKLSKSWWCFPSCFTFSVLKTIGKLSVSSLTDCTDTISTLSFFFSGIVKWQFPFDSAELSPSRMPIRYLLLVFITCCLSYCLLIKVIHIQVESVDKREEEFCFDVVAIGGVCGEVPVLLPLFFDDWAI